MRQPSKSLPVALFFAKISEKEARELGKLSQPRTVKSMSLREGLFGLFFDKIDELETRVAPAWHLGCAEV
jgi:hypothetical protein